MGKGVVALDSNRPFVSTATRERSFSNDVYFLMMILSDHPEWSFIVVFTT
jgi:hypothetical protein